MKEKIKKLYKYLVKEKKNIKYSSVGANLDHYNAFEKEIFEKVKPYTMTSVERLSCLIDSVNYIQDNELEGDFVECGVWKGGSVMAMAYSLQQRQVLNKKIYLFDTFDGMSPPTDSDVDFKGVKAAERLAKEDKNDSWGWAYSPMEEVKKNLDSTGYPLSNFTLVKGKVEDTIPTVDLPERISLLRLDTDWYDSTKIEMEYLFPRLVKGGVLIIDDYGHWQGCRKAIEEYLQKNRVQIFLHRIDYTGRAGVKLTN